MPAKPNATPVAMQPMPLSPGDRLRVQYHIWEAVTLGKMREVDTVKEVGSIQFKSVYLRLLEKVEKFWHAKGTGSWTWRCHDYGWAKS